MRSILNLCTLMSVYIVVGNPEDGLKHPSLGQYGILGEEMWAISCNFIPNIVHLHQNSQLYTQMLYGRLLTWGGPYHKDCELLTRGGPYHKDCEPPQYKYTKLQVKVFLQMENYEKVLKTKERQFKNLLFVFHDSERAMINSKYELNEVGESRTWCLLFP